MSTEKQGMPPTGDIPPAYQPQQQGAYPQQYYPPQGQYYQYPAQAQQPGQPNAPQQVMYVQPGTTVMTTTTTGGSPPPDHLTYAILVTICCCWPIGIFAIIKSSECRSAVNRGDYQSAMEYSKKAKSLANWALGIGIVFAVVSITLIVLVYVLYLIPLWTTLSRKGYN